MEASSRFLRTLLTAVAVIGFYLLALGLAAALILLGLSPFLFGWSISGVFIIWSLIGGAVILWSVLPRWDSFEPPGPRLEPLAHPRLFQKLQDVARATDQKMPSDVYLIPEVNAAVMERGGILGIGTRRVMLLGLPAMRILSISEMQAILAHEFGHFYGGDTKLGPWVYKTRLAIVRTIQNLPKRNHLALLWFLFDWYGRAFMRLTFWVSRLQEHSADALAARTYGTESLAHALCKLNGFAPIYNGYWVNEMVPVLKCGFVPPWTEGLSRVVAAPVMQRAFSEILQMVIEGEEPNQFNTHPVLRDRLSALGQPQNLQISFDGTPATSLLDGVRDIEAHLVSSTHILSPADGLKQIGWEDTGKLVYLPRWREKRDRFPDVWSRIWIFTLAESLSQVDLADLGKKFTAPGELPPPAEYPMRGIGAVGATLSLALADQGWSLRVWPEGMIIMSKDDKTIEPFKFVHEIKEGKVRADEWRKQCSDLGIIDASLMPSDPVNSQCSQQC